MIEIKLFYAWQDDRPPQVTRSVIRSALEKAAQAIQADRDGAIQLVIEEATDNTPGMCDIPNTILKKIRECDVFVCDLTFIGEIRNRKREVKKVSNPNVVLELGYAARSIKWRRVLGVMNTVFGRPEQHMFDIKRRHALRYSLHGTADQAAIEAATLALAEKMKDPLSLIIDKEILPKRAATKATVRSEIRSAFEEKVKRGSFHRLTKAPTIAISLLPIAPHRIRYEELRSAVIQPPFAVYPGPPVGWRPENRGKSVLSVLDESGATGSRCRYAIAEITASGQIFAANARVLDPKDHFMLYGEFGRKADILNEGKFIGSEEFEKTVIDSVTSYVRTMKRLAIQPPLDLCVSLLGIKGFCMVAGNTASPEILEDRDDLRADPVTITSFSGVHDVPAIATMLRLAFDYFSREFGFGGSSSYDRSGNWRSR